LGTEKKKKLNQKKKRGSRQEIWRARYQLLSKVHGKEEGVRRRGKKASYGQNKDQSRGPPKVTKGRS